MACTRCTGELVWDLRKVRPAVSVTPGVTHLCSEACTTTHGAYSAAGGRYAKVFTGLAPGWFAGAGNPVSAEDTATNICQPTPDEAPTSPQTPPAASFALARPSTPGASPPAAAPPRPASAQRVRP